MGVRLLVNILTAESLWKVTIQIATIVKDTRHFNHAVVEATIED